MGFDELLFIIYTIILISYWSLRICVFGFIFMISKFF